MLWRFDRNERIEIRNGPTAMLEDDRIIEVSWEGKIVWEWVASDHIDSATYVGPNRWYGEGDKRFAPNNAIISSRQSSFLAIIARDGSIAIGT